MTMTEFILYLIYGFAMITMGIFAIVQKDTKIMNLSFIKSLNYLGYFGITHGISEWISMMIKLEISHPYSYPELNNINIIIKAVSFAFLMYFGLDLLPLREKHKKIFLKIPITYLLIYSAGFLFLITNYGPEYHLANSQYNNISLRYLMGFPSCLISAIALYINASQIEKTKSIEISRRYKKLAWVFVVYGFMEGLLVSKADYFPANILNKELFIEYFEFTPLLIKAFVGFIIYYLLMKVIDTFSWEQEEKFSRLEKHRIATIERRKLGREIHDSIIQELFAAGLKVEYLIMDKNGKRRKEILDQVKVDLNNTIEKIRAFISSSSLDKIEFEDLNSNLQQMVQRFNENQTIKIKLISTASPYQTDYLTPEKSTQIYYIIQEAITNIIKHSEAEYANILLEARYACLFITISDNGKGISQENPDPQKQFGISSMKERTERAGGVFTIQKTRTGTLIELRIPWEEIQK